MSNYFNYRRPYYYRRRRFYRRRRDESLNIRSAKPFLIIFGALIAASVISSPAAKNLLSFLFGIFILFSPIILIVFLISRLKNKSDDVIVNKANLVGSENLQENVVDSIEINTEKHGCKCYMDDLTEGEQEIAHILAEGLSYKDYFIFNNLTIPSDVNGSSQIDHLVISRFGIFVIESKNLKGWIFGTKEQEHWTQSLSSEHRFQFQNPIRQNWSHIMALRKLMPFIPENLFQSIVVFTDASEIKTAPIENVVKMEDLVSLIVKHSETKLSEENLHMAIGKLSYVCQTADISASQHVENIKLHHPE